MAKPLTFPQFVAVDKNFPHGIDIGDAAQRIHEAYGFTGDGQSIQNRMYEWSSKDNPSLAYLWKEYALYAWDFHRFSQQDDAETRQFLLEAGDGCRDNPGVPYRGYNHDTDELYQKYYNAPSDASASWLAERAWFFYSISYIEAVEALLK